MEEVVTFAVVGVGVNVSVVGGSVDAKNTMHSKTFQSQKKKLNARMPRNWNILNSEVKKFAK